MKSYFTLWWKERQELRESAVNPSSSPLKLVGVILDSTAISYFDISLLNKHTRTAILGVFSTARRFCDDKICDDDNLLLIVSMELRSSYCKLNLLLQLDPVTTGMYHWQ